MEKIKPESVKGIFYPSDKEELKELINSFNVKSSIPRFSRAVIVPHAGLIYSGDIALSGIKTLSCDIKNLFIFAPAHKVPFSGLSVSSFEFWQTPLGKIPVNTEINQELINDFPDIVKFNDSAFCDEHSIEVEIPLIQTVFEEVKIIPVLTGSIQTNTAEEIISKYYNDSENGFIISSDLSHFLNGKEAERIDAYTAELIEANDFENFKRGLACGIDGIKGLVHFARKNNFSLIRNKMKNSGVVTGENSRVVGYGSWFLYEGGKNEFLKKYYSDFIKKIVLSSITSKLKGELPKISYPSVFDEFGASFVTLNKNGNLRGCIGSIIAQRPLIEDLISNSISAAFFDPRFKPVRQEELNELEIAVSLLTKPVKIEFDNEDELLDKTEKDKDGIIIQDLNKRAVYLPSVWEQIPDKRDFLNSLKVKAGLPYNHFSKTFAAYKFQTVYIK